MPRFATILLTLVALLSLAGCSSQGPEVALNDQVPADQRSEAGATEGGTTEGGTEGAGGGEGATFVAVDIDFSQAPSELPAGETQLELINEGQAPHNVTFESVNNEEPVVETGPGETASGSVQLESGEYTFYCSVPGHREAGMEGTLTVSG